MFSGVGNEPKTVACRRRHRASGCHYCLSIAIRLGSHSNANNTACQQFPDSRVASPPVESPPAEPRLVSFYPLCYRQDLQRPLQAIFCTNFCDIQQKKYFPLAGNSIRTFQFRLGAWKRTNGRAKGIAKFAICKLFFDTIMRLPEIRLWQTCSEAATWRGNTLWEKTLLKCVKYIQSDH